MIPPSGTRWFRSAPISIPGIRDWRHRQRRRLGIADGGDAHQDYTDYDTRDHHTNMDFAERVKLDDLKQSAIVLATFAYHAAMRAESIPRAPKTVP